MRAEALEFAQLSITYERGEGGMTGYVKALPAIQEAEETLIG